MTEKDHVSQAVSYRPAWTFLLWAQTEVKADPGPAATWPLRVIIPAPPAGLPLPPSPLAGSGQTSPGRREDTAYSTGCSYGHCVSCVNIHVSHPTTLVLLSPKG